MNKLHVLALAGLMFCGVNNALAMGQEQRELLYTLHTLKQDFTQIPMIAQNIDMFMGVMEMNIQLTELKLKNATKELKTALWKNAALVGGVWISSLTLNSVKRFIFANLSWDIRSTLPVRVLDEFIVDGITCGWFCSKAFAALNLHGVWKKRSELMQVLALDREILSKLQEIKDSIDNSGLADNSVSPEKFLLENAE